jgi:hypothetical protein
MAVISSYATLQTAITDYLARSDLSTFTPNFIQNWEERFYRDAQNWASWMEAALSVSISSNVAAVPADYLGLKVAYIGTVTAPLKRVTLSQLYARYPRGGGSSGTAEFIARDGANFRFGPEGVSGTLAGTYYAKPAVLRTATTNWLTTNAPDLLLYGALLEAEPFLKNDVRIGIWQGFYQQALEAYRSRFKEEEYLAPFMVAV